jgi:DNA-binding response OmpR family regulator
VKILVVDDDAVTRRTISGILAKNEYEYAVTDSVRGAISHLESDSTIRLIILDYKMPGGDGIELLEYLKNNLRFSNIPVLMSSSVNDMETVKKSIRMGAKDYLVKPVVPDILLGKIKNIFERTAGTILIVDEDRVISSFLTKALEREGYKAIAVGSGEEAIEKVKQAKPKIDLVLSEIVLPGMNGFELLVALKGESWKLPVLLIVRESGKFSKEDAISAGADNYITKPFNNVEIIRKLISFNLHPK